MPHANELNQFTLVQLRFAGRSLPSAITESSNSGYVLEASEVIQSIETQLRRCRYILSRAPKVFYSQLNNNYYLLVWPIV